jgi:hypothetical protein
MKRTTKLTLLFTAAALIMTLGSCSKWLNPGEETKVVWATISTTYGMPPGEEYPFYFITDDSLLYCPMNHTSIDDDFEPVDGQRLILYYKFKETTTQEEGEEETLNPGDIKHIDIVQMQLVDTKEFYYTYEPDTLGTDRVEPQYLWFAGGGLGTKRYLNLQLSIQAYNPEKHSFVMAYNLSRETPLEDGYYCLELHHQAKDDPLYNNYNTLISYPLEGPCVEEGVKGLKITVNTINQGIKVYTLDY